MALDILQGLNSIDRPSEQTTLLLKLKNEIIGHPLRKKDCVDHGAVQLLAGVLRAQTNSFEKSTHIKTSKGSHRRDASLSKQAAFLGAVEVTTVLANGGPEFVDALLDADISNSILVVLCEPHCPGATAVSILRCLNALADQLPSSEFNYWSEDKRLAKLLYSQPFVACFNRLLVARSECAIAQEASSLCLLLLTKTCTEEIEKRSLLKAGVLSTLATMLASFVVSTGYVFPATDNQAPLSLPAAPSTNLPLVLQAASVLTERSKLRSQHLIGSPAIAAVMPPKSSEMKTNTHKAAWSQPLLSSSRPQRQGWLDTLLPAIPPTQIDDVAEQTSFPPLGSVVYNSRKKSSVLTSQKESWSSGLVISEKPEEDESPLVGWLLALVKTEVGLCRLMATRLVVTLFSLGFVKQSRARQLGMMLIPVLTAMLHHSPNTGVQGIQEFVTNVSDFKMTIQVPSLIATLVMDDHELQKIAVEAGAIEKLTQAVRDTFDPLQGHIPTMWSPIANPATNSSLIKSNTMPGAPSPDGTVRRLMQYREGALKALASIAPFNDDYRKAICDQGVLPYIIDSLKPCSSSRPVQQSAETPALGLGNPPATLLAACSITQVLTRSVSALRTNLMDAGIASPVLNLLSSTDPEVKIGATRVVANLAMDFSPMKDAISRQSVVRKICEQAHSANPRLRFESIWALKQLVLNSPNALKINVIQELGPSWIAQLISTDPLDIPRGVVIGLVDMEFPPQPQQYLDYLSVSGDMVMSESADALSCFEEASQDVQQDNDPNQHTTQDDTAIQEQLLDLIRNLFCGDSASEVIEYLLSEIDQQEFFGIMLTRLRYRTVSGPTRKENKSLPPPTAIVAKVLYVISHIAAVRSRFRSLVSANTALLRQLLVYCGHSSPEVRARIAWIAINLTYEEEKAEQQGCRIRAQDLQRAGYLSKLTSMVEDTDMDVRERSRTAVYLLRQFI